MLKSYFKLALRHLVKNRLASVINIAGLSIAIACAIVVFLFLDWQYSHEAFHENKESIYLLNKVMNREGHEEIWGTTPAPLGPALQADYPQVMAAVRILGEEVIAKYEDNVFEEDIQFVDKEFLDIFTFPLKFGDKATALQDKNNIVMSEPFAKKYFGNENPVGKQLTLIFESGSQEKYKESFFVSGVAKEFPDNASLGFTILIPMEKKLELGVNDLNDWSKSVNATFIQLTAPEHMEGIQFDNYIQLQNATDPDFPIKTFMPVPLTEMSNMAHRVQYSISGGSHPAGRVALTVIVACLLGLACFNYMNIAIVSATRRLKEIGLRKVVGGLRIQLIKQFIGENMILCLISMILGIGLAEFMLVPGFNEYIGREYFSIKIDFLSNLGLWLFLLGLLLLTGVGAGAYPAMYISSFQPVNIFREKLRLGGRNRFTKTLLAIQFLFSFITVSAGIVFMQNGEYQKNRDWGYNQEQTIAVPVDGNTTYLLFHDEIAQNPNILGTAGTRHHVGRATPLVAFEYVGQKYQTRLFDVGYDYLQTLGLRLWEGRFFERERATDIKEAIVINETFARKMQWDAPLQKQIVYDSTVYTVVGVVEDFHYYSFFDSIEPVMIRLTEADHFNYLAVKIKAGSVAQTADYLESTWKKLNPETPYAGFYQDEVLAFFFREIKGITQLTSFTAIIALLISCMGLFGLISLNITKRMKEFSIRKVLGASLLHVTKLVNKDFIVLMMIAIGIAAPLSFYLLNMMLSSVFQYHIDLGITPFLLTAVCLLLTASLTVSSLIYKVARMNPVTGLRDE